MCGLIGVLLAPRARPKKQWLEIRQLFEGALVANEERGRLATGVGIVSRNGDVVLSRAPVGASEFVVTPAFRRTLEELGPATSCLLGHTRLPTKGSHLDDRNNHPLRAGWVVGIHNGIIDNDEDLAASLGLTRECEVDSEVLFHLLASVEVDGSHARYLSGVRDSLRPVRGTFASLSVDLRLPERLLVLKEASPLCLHYEDRLGALFLCSRYLFLRKAFGRPVVTSALPQHGAYLFDATAPDGLSGMPSAEVELAASAAVTPQVVEEPPQSFATPATHEVVSSGRALRGREPSSLACTQLVIGRRDP